MPRFLVGGKIKKNGILKMKITPSEHQEQVCIFQWVELQKTKYPELDLLFAIPNGGLRNIITAKKLKAEGVRAGVPDLMLPVPRNGYHGLFIELKTKTGKAQKNQLDWINKLNQQNYRALVCYGADDAIKSIQDYLNAPVTA